MLKSDKDPLPFGGHSQPLVPVNLKGLNEQALPGPQGMDPVIDPHTALPLNRPDEDMTVMLGAKGVSRLQGFPEPARKNQDVLRSKGRSDLSTPPIIPRLLQLPTPPHQMLAQVVFRPVHKALGFGISVKNNDIPAIGPQIFSVKMPGMEKTSPIKIGLLGAGQRLRSVIKHLLAEAGDQIHIMGVSDPDPLSQEAVREAFGSGVEIFPAEKDLIHSEADWIFIGSLNCQHAEQAISAMQAGKNVFCEKPLATNFADCLRVRRTEKETGRVFSFGLVLRYSPFYQKLKALVDEGAIGDLVSFEFNETLGFNHGGYIFGNWRRNRELAGTHILEKCCHDLDLANWITGRLPVRVASFGGRNIFTEANGRLVEKIGPGPDHRPAYSQWPDPHAVPPFSPGATIFDNQVAIIQYTGGVRATFHTNCNTAILERRFFLCGTEGTLRANAYTGLIEHQQIGWNTIPETIDTQAAGGHGGGDSVMARGLLGTLTRAKPPLATASDGLRACAVAFGIDTAADSNQVTSLQPYWDAIAGCEDAG